MAFFDHTVLAFMVSVCCCLLCMNGECKITPGERSKIINLHNTFRASVTPSASDMEKMVRCIVHKTLQGGAYSYHSPVDNMLLCILVGSADALPVASYIALA